ncbi:MAG: CcmD family protein [Ignavibacteria bacterium]|nr:CcmD family protein [Ignavibacteria bacterium]
MFDFLSSNPLYIVLIISLVVWGGIYIYMARLQRRVETLEKQNDSQR